MFFFPINSNIGNNNRVICKEIYQFNLTVINAQRLYTLYSILHIKSKTKIKTKYKETKKKRVTAGEVDKLGKELGNCTHQWKMNNDTNTQALSTLSLLQVKEER